MQTKAGLKLRSNACTTEVIVVRPAAEDVAVTCCGQPMTTDDVTAPTTAPEQHEILLGKRYTDEVTGIELLCTKPGQGPLAVDGRPVVLKGTKALPASD
jgi:hypothetical protein